MSSLDEILKAANLGRTIGDPIARGMEAGNQRQFEAQQALQKFQQQKQLEAMVQAAADRRQQQSFQNEVGLDAAKSPALGMNTFDLTPKQTEPGAPMSIPALPPSPDQKILLNEGINPSDIPAAPVQKIGNSSMAVDPKGLQRTLDSLAADKRKADLGADIEKIKAQEQMRMTQEFNKPVRTSVINTKTGQIREVVTMPGSPSQLEEGEIPLNQSVFRAEGGIGSKGDASSHKETQAFVKDTSSELEKDPAVKFYQESSRRTDQAHKLYEDAKKTGDYSAATSHLLETYQRLNTNQAVRAFTYNSVKGNQPLSSWIEGTFQGIQRGGAGISDQTFKSLMDAIDSMNDIAKEDTVQKLQNFEKSAEAAGYGDAYRKQVLPKFGLDITPKFSSEEEASKAGLKDGQTVIINGKKATYRSH